MKALTGMAVLFAVSWLMVFAGGMWFEATAATAFFAVAFLIFAVGECLHGTVQAPLVTDLADHSLIGRYMAASAFSWGVGFALGPAIGGVVMNHWPHALWPAAAAVCLAAGAAELALERAIPAPARTTPKRAQPALAEA